MLVGLFLANDALRHAFNLGKQAKLRLIKVVVRSEELTPNYEYAGTSNWRDDWRATLPECVDAFEPCFILFRLNTITEWILITFADDRAPVKEKMLLAATCATFKSEFGACYVEYEKHVTDRKDLSLESFENWLKTKSELGPMSEVERGKCRSTFFALHLLIMTHCLSLELHNAQQERAVVAHAGPQHMKGVAFPLDRNAEDAVRKLGQGSLAFVQLSVDTLNEAIKLEGTEEKLPASQLASKIPRDKPRYTFYRLDHSNDGRPQSSTFFIYSLPSSGSSIKERMLYSSCKSPFLETATKHLGIEISKKMEVDSKDDLSEKALMEALYPVPQESPKLFARPAPPRGAGARRITKV
ncbi:Cofilin/tropomyosin-type actin-binding protein [Oesophagostomum dentatum]|uniref:Twinfilin n=1 Tax=Oesophagostomum dentatum TaxID=61180 RepID=A0A0B1TK01_OESDE|nr:Cofilin/tropomyosin-type actin-binding protein [Oesophagostomum dentatum]